MRRLAFLAVFAALAAPSTVVRADPGQLNLHVDLAAELPIAGYYAFPSEAEHSARIGGRLGLGLDYVLVGPLALDALVTLGYLAETDGSYRNAQGQSESGSLTASVALGARLRLLESRRLWLAAHLGYHKFDNHQIGFDAAVGYDFRLSDRTDLGVFLRWQITGLGESQNVIADEHWDASLQLGAKLSYALIPARSVEREPVTPTPVGPADRDGDRILDIDDQCPDEPEDHDGVEDLDGCPEDDDRDGVPDAVDQCRDVPEDRDGFQDEDGCPDPDNDQDGTDDLADDCPNIAGPVWNGGCPEPDRDGDMIGDSRDNCPDEVGTLENHGCPTRQLVVITDNQLQILDSIYFRTNKHQIDPRSHSLLDNIAAVMNAHPEIVRVRIEGHTDARGNAARNTTLSQKRANEVMKYLVRRGVSADRLEARGFGPSNPLVPGAATEDEHAQNRRVEFNIVR